MRLSVVAPEKWGEQARSLTIGRASRDSGAMGGLSTGRGSASGKRATTCLSDTPPGHSSHSTPGHKVAHRFSLLGRTPPTTKVFGLGNRGTFPPLLLLEAAKKKVRGSKPRVPCEAAIVAERVGA